MPRFLEPVPLNAIGGHSVLLQTGFWGSFKSQFGWRANSFLIEGSLPLLVLSRTIGGAFSFSYVPHGPVATTSLNQNEYYLTAVTRSLVPFLPSGCVFIRYDLPWGRVGAGIEAPTLARPFRRAAMDVQVPSTVLVDLKPSEAEILQAMKHKTRYNIRLAERKGVVVRRGTLADFDRWYALYQETAKRDRISIHSPGYYRRLFELSEAAEGTGAPEIFLMLATSENDLLAGIVVAVHGDRATYLFGASSNLKRNYMASYLIQWQAMREVKARGCELYDLFGIPFRDDPEDPLYGLYRFKTGFGGMVVNRPGSWDYPLLQGMYAVYRAAERTRKFYYKDFRKQNRQGGG